MKFDKILGKEIFLIDGFEVGSERIYIEFTDGTRLVMKHFQDCCEVVKVNDVDLSNEMVLQPGDIIYQFDESRSRDQLFGEEVYADSFTWTFYRIRTQRGYAVIRWLGESNGYYSERVDIQILNINEKEMD